MKSSPIIMAHILSSICKTFPDAIIYHYTEDIVICTQLDIYLDTVLKRTIKTIEDAGLETVQDKIQSTCPWTCLGLWIGESTVVPQQLPIKDDPKTLQDLHQLCGIISWVCALLGITTKDLTLLFNLL